MKKIKKIFNTIAPYGGTILLFILSYSFLDYLTEDYVPLLAPLIFVATYYLLKKANN